MKSHRVFTSQRPRSYNLDQPNIFEPFTCDEQVRKPRNSPTTYKKVFNHKNQSIHNLTNQLKCITQMHKSTALLFTTTRINRKSIYKLFSNTKHRRININDYESKPNGWILNLIK